MDLSSITDGEVRKALACIRGARPLHGSALLQLGVLRHRLFREGLATTDESLEWALVGLLHDTVAARLTLLRSSQDVPSDSGRTTSSIKQLTADFAVGSVELEAWSSIYHQFLCPSLNLRVSDLAAAALPSHRNRSGERLVQRRVRRAVHELTSELRDIEHGASCDQIDPSTESTDGSVTRVERSHDISASLPGQLTSFVDRTVELASLEALFAQPEARLITIVGPGGSGKTRLGIESCQHSKSHFPDGVYFVALAQARNDRDVLILTAEALGATVHGGELLRQQVVDVLSDKKILVLLDAFEAVIDDAGLLADLLHAAPGLTIAVTSRSRLGLLSERVLVVDGLPIPSVSRAGIVPVTGAVELFRDRAKAANPAFQLDASTQDVVVQICRLVDGMPLAIEIAASLSADSELSDIAAAVRAGPDQLTTDRDDVPLEHRSLQTVFDQSWSTLPSDERGALARLDVFRGGFTIDAAQDVADVTSSQVAALSSRSLVRKTSAGRQYTHRTLHGFASAKFAEESGSSHEDDGALRGALREASPTPTEPQNQLAERHAAYFVALAERAEVHLSGANVGVWLQRLNAERGNFIAAYEWARSQGDAELCLSLCAALARYWELTGMFLDGLDQLKRCLTLVDPDSVSPSHAKALNGAGSLAEEIGDYAGARAYFERSLDIRRALGDECSVAETLSNLGNIADFRGDYETAHALHGEALELRRRCGDRRGIAISLNNLGNVDTFRGHYDDARAMYDESHVLFRALGDRWAVSVVLNNIGRVTMEQGDLAAARKALRRSLAVARELGDRQGVAYALHNLGELYLAEGKTTMAERLLSESLRESAEIGNSQGVAASLEWLAHVSAVRDEGQHAVRLFAAAAAVREDIDAPVTENERERLDRALNQLLNDLGSQSYELAWSSGHIMTRDEATEYALRGVADDGTT